MIIICVHLTTMSLSIPDNIYEYIENFVTISDDDVEELKQYLCSLELVEMTYVKGETKVHVGSDHYNIHLINQNEIYEIILVNKTISTINKMKTNIDIEEIQKKSELQDFPMKLGDKYEIRTTDTIAMLYNIESCEETPLKIIALHSSPNESHEPLYEYKDYIKHDQFMPIHIDGLEKGMYAFVIVRFAWGLNISAGIFDESSQTLYHWGSDNYDYPEGISVRQTGANIEIYLNCDGRSERETIYCDKVLEKSERFDYSLDWSHDSHWIQFDKLDFYRLSQYVKYCNEQLDYTSFHQRINKIEEDSIKLFEQKMYLDALNLYNTIFEIYTMLGDKPDLRIVMNRCEFMLMAKPELKDEIIEKLLTILQTSSRGIFKFGDKDCIKELKENDNYAEIRTDERIAKYLT